MLYYRKLSKNKGIEISSRNNFKSNIFDLNCSINKKQSHAGFHFFIAIFTWIFEFNIYDVRHWDYENNCWEVYIECESDVESKVKKASVDEHENNRGIGA